MNIKHLTLIGLVVFAIAMLTFSAADQKVLAHPASISSDKATVVTGSARVIVDVKHSVLAIGKAVSLSGKSTYALSMSQPTFTPIFDNSIDRQRPDHQPPVT